MILKRVFITMVIFAYFQYSWVYYLWMGHQAHYHCPNTSFCSLFLHLYFLTTNWIMHDWYKD
ncbi:hypothetical protein BDV38DRAFT_235523 [Aspergillus pseudotamarii]|uniref:Uncharacterized protein n=1 Tax=Aspergillus pseudotamarii TaxID=132259 RepID=A0A5N6T8V6_ASPPS|nr:uncharacterized protein BDV38DRAFT_235523 [Aspergillus pseudotamarii]KAE8142697.1 hypothetical protein BDV38DRAFT_235523 [Aspergillus pseudotamarii]